MYTSNPKLKPLLTLGELKRRDWPDYVRAHGFGRDDVPGLIAMACDKALDYGDYPGHWGPVHAWRSLGQLRAVDAIATLIACFDWLQNDDHALDELPKVMGMIGPAAIPLLTNHLLEESGAEEFSRVLAMESLASIAMEHPEQRDAVLAIFRGYMAAPEAEMYALNGFLMAMLIELKAMELIDDIRRLFALGCVDLPCVGDLEEVELELGLRTRRSSPRPPLLPDLAGQFPWEDRDHREPMVTAPKIGRNDPCPCGSGKKFKKCCGNT